MKWVDREEEEEEYEDEYEEEEEDGHIEEGVSRPPRYTLCLLAQQVVSKKIKELSGDPSKEEEVVELKALLAGSQEPGAY